MIEIEEYRLQLRFPEDFPLLQKSDDANIDDAKVRLLVVDALHRLFAGREIKPQRSEIEKAGAILELALGRDLDFDLNRCKLIGHLIKTSGKEADLVDHIVAGLKNRGYV
jgi:hypothetical protein